MDPRRDGALEASGAEGRLSRARRIARALRALALASALAFAGAELCLRWRLGSPRAERLPLLRVQANDWRGWEMVPGEAHYTYDRLVHVSSLGLRGEESGEREPNELRVLCLGDSLVYGQGVGDEECLPAALERALAAGERQGRRWRVFNGGLRAYATHQELGLLDELGSQIAPDLVVLFWFSNDFNERSIPGNAEHLRKTGPQIFDLGLSELGGADLWRWRLRQLLRRSACLMELRDLWLARRNPPLTLAQAGPGLERFDEHMRHYARSLAGLGARGFVACIPDAAEIVSEHPSRELGQAVLQHAAAAGFGTLDLLPALQSLDPEEVGALVIPFDGHYEAAAYTAMAQALAPLLLR